MITAQKYCTDVSICDTCRNNYNAVHINETYRGLFCNDISISSKESNNWVSYVVLPEMLHRMIQVFINFTATQPTKSNMLQLQKYTWLIDTIRKAGKISLKELSNRWERNKDLSDYKPLSRATFNRWKDAIFSQFGIIISCQRAGGYLYYIENPEDIDEDELKKWMLDSFAVSNLISEHLSLKDRILVSKIPSARNHLAALLEAMSGNRVVTITYCRFNKSRSHKFTIKPYCVKLFENRWYVLAHNSHYDDYRIYGLDRIEDLEMTTETFKLPEEFSASDYFSNYYGIISDSNIKPERIVIRAYRDHIPYMKSLPLHHSQKLLEDNGEYADFEFFLAPTFDFIMKLLSAGAMIEVINPASLRKTLKGWISDMYNLYKND